MYRNALENGSGKQTLEDSSKIHLFGGKQPAPWKPEGAGSLVLGGLWISAPQLWEGGVQCWGTGGWSLHFEDQLRLSGVVPLRLNRGSVGLTLPGDTTRQG